MSDENTSSDPQPTPPSSSPLRNIAIVSVVYVVVVIGAFLVSAKAGFGLLMTAVVLGVILLFGRTKENVPVVQVTERPPRRRSAHEPSRHERGGGGLAGRLSDRASRREKE